jgi:hypothetical protein
MDKFAKAIKCITKIEDFLEYKYKNHSKEEIKVEIMNIIDSFTIDLSETKIKE